jgi:acetoacetate decarboxylase
MMKRSTVFIVAAGLCAVLALSALTGFAQDGKAKPPRADFVPSPVFSPPYPPLPHHFSDVKTVQILCQAPAGAMKRAVMPPMEPTGAGDLFVLLLAWTGDVEKGGYNVHEIAINTPVKWKDKVGNTTVIEYIDSDMGLLAGREIYGWPKKMADITWTKTAAGWIIVANKMRDQGSLPLMKVEYKASKSAPAVRWPNMGPTLLVRRIPPASLTTPAFFQMVCVGCSMPAASGPADSSPLEAPAGPNDTKGTATVQFFDGPHDPLTFMGPIKVLDAKSTVLEGEMPFGLGLGDVLANWEE